MKTKDSKSTKSAAVKQQLSTGSAASASDAQRQVEEGAAARAAQDAAADATGKGAQPVKAKHVKKDAQGQPVPDKHGKVPSQRDIAASAQGKPAKDKKPAKPEAQPDELAFDKRSMYYVLQAADVIQRRGAKLLDDKARKALRPEALKALEALLSGAQHVKDAKLSKSDLKALLAK